MCGSFDRMAPFIRRSARLTCPILCTLSIVSVFTRLASVSILSDWVSPYPAGYGFPLPFGCWPSLLKQSLPPYGYVPPLPLAYELSLDRMGVITFRILKLRPT